VKPVGAPENTDFSRRSQNRASPAVTRSAATDEQFDDAILRALRESPSGSMPWATLRAQLPKARFWKPIEALVRLHQSGQVNVVKLDGRNYVGLPIVVRVA
jgi:hypothetical protein